MLLELVRCHMLHAPLPAGIAPRHRYRKSREKHLHLPVAAQTGILHMESVRLQLLEARLDVPPTHIRQRRGRALYPMTGKNQQFTLDCSQAALNCPADADLSRESAAPHRQGKHSAPGMRVASSESNTDFASVAPMTIPAIHLARALFRRNPTASMPASLSTFSPVQVVISNPLIFSRVLWFEHCVSICQALARAAPAFPASARNGRCG